MGERPTRLFGDLSESDTPLRRPIQERHASSETYPIATRLFGDLFESDMPQEIQFTDLRHVGSSHGLRLVLDNNISEHFM